MLRKANTTAISSKAKSMQVIMVPIAASHHQQADVVHDKSDYPSHCDLEECCETNSCPTAGLLFDSSQRCSAGDIEQTEDHQAVGV